MTRRLFLLPIVCFLLMAANTGSATYEPVQIVNLTSKPIVAASLNGTKAYFIVDTGSGITLLNKNDKATYEFKTTSSPLFEQHAIDLKGNTTELLDAHKVNLMVGNTQIKTHFMSCDMDRVVASVKRRTGYTVQGIIGSDVMKKYRVMIDYEKEVLVFKPKK
ncbi:MAG: hypothetical protein AAGI38_05435 [Bacteroidota bacterium]